MEKSLTVWLFVLLKFANIASMKLSIVSYLDAASMVKVREVQKHLSDITGSMASMELWLPHITVGDGLEVDAGELQLLQTDLTELAKCTSEFDVTLSDIIKIDSRKGGEGEQTTPYGLYLDVKQTDQLLELVSATSNISLNFKKWYFMPRPYHPHCALAFKDLSKEGFERGIAYLDTHQLILTSAIDHIAIVEMLPNDTREFARFSFT